MALVEAGGGFLPFPHIQQAEHRGLSAAHPGGRLDLEVFALPHAGQGLSLGFRRSAHGDEEALRGARQGQAGHDAAGFSRVREAQQCRGYAAAGAGQKGPGQRLPVAGGDQFAEAAADNLLRVGVEEWAEGAGGPFDDALRIHVQQQVGAGEGEGGHVRQAGDIAEHREVGDGVQTGHVQGQSELTGPGAAVEVLLLDDRAGGGREAGDGSGQAGEQMAEREEDIVQRRFAEQGHQQLRGHGIAQPDRAVGCEGQHADWQDLDELAEFIACDVAWCGHAHPPAR